MDVPKIEAANCIRSSRRQEAGSYIELVVSSSQDRSGRSRSKQEIIDLALAELAEFFPAIREAKL